MEISINCTREKGHFQDNNINKCKFDKINIWINVFRMYIFTNSCVSEIPV